MKTPRITKAQEIKAILEPISSDLFQTKGFGHNFNVGDNTGLEDNGKSCALGHVHRHFRPNDSSALGDHDGYGTRQLTRTFLETKHNIRVDISDVNNTDHVNGYIESNPKARVMHLLDDMIKAGY